MAHCQSIVSPPLPPTLEALENASIARTTNRSVTPFDPIWLDRREDEAWFSAAARNAGGKRLIDRARRFASRWQLGPCAERSRVDKVMSILGPVHVRGRDETIDL